MAKAKADLSLRVLGRVFAGSLVAFFLFGQMYQGKPPLSYLWGVLGFICFFIWVGTGIAWLIQQKSWKQRGYGFLGFVLLFFTSGIILTVVLGDFLNGGWPAEQSRIHAQLGTLKTEFDECNRQVEKLDKQANAVHKESQLQLEAGNFAGYDANFKEYDQLSDKSLRKSDQCEGIRTRASTLYEKL